MRNRVSRQAEIATPLGVAISLSKKSSYGWAFSHVYGKISMGDERCWNEGNWTEVS